MCAPRPSNDVSLLGVVANAKPHWALATALDIVNSITPYANIVVCLSGFQTR